MKRTVLLILLFWLIFHFIVPFFIIEFYLGDLGTYGVYSSNKGFWVNIISISIAMIIIYMDKSNDSHKKIAPTSTSTKQYFILSLVISVVYFIKSGGAEGVLEGRSSGAMISYLSLLFDINFAVYFIFFFSKNKIKYPVLYLLIFVIFQTWRGNRSGVLVIVLLYLYLTGYQNFYIYSNTIKKTIIVLSVLSPFLFLVASQIRGFDKINLTEAIVGRVSMIELSGIPLDYMDNNKLNWDYYDSKYGFSNQLKQTFNSISPLDVFEQDVHPNQYYRSIFLGRPESFVKNNYMSVNLTLPVFFVLMTRSYFFGVLLTVLFLVGYYKLMIRKRKSVIYYTVLILNLYQFLYFFDLPMILRGIFFMIIAMYILKWFDRIKGNKVTRYNI